ncbi:unnamed protein product [Allacma fusca]|uniref:Uncharacterized protein n=1 Tax=Allacma fusca TaxID=39272 RepID=A0A8J2LD96_9HEXA|nr:unnamed protein product [Allacma fusca]
MASSQNKVARMGWAMRTSHRCELRIALYEYEHRFFGLIFSSYPGELEVDKMTGDYMEIKLENKLDMNDYQLKPNNSNRMNIFASEVEVATIWHQPDPRDYGFVPSELTHSPIVTGHNRNNGSDYVMEVEVPTNTGHLHQLHHHNHHYHPHDLLHSDTLSTVTVNENFLGYPVENTPKRKFCSLTQRRKKLVDKYIHEVLTKSHDYDYGEFGSNLWSALLLEYFREDKDQQVGIESIEHWARHTSWGRRMRKAYDIGIETIKNGGDALREFEIAKCNVFRKRPAYGEEAIVTKQRGRRRKCETVAKEADPQALNGIRNDHEYCKNPWLETFGDVYSQNSFESPQESECDTTERIYDMGAIGGEVEI